MEELLTVQYICLRISSKVEQIFYNCSSTVGQKMYKKNLKGSFFRPSKNVKTAIFLMFPKNLNFVYDVDILHSCSLGSLL